MELLTQEIILGVIDFIILTAIFYIYFKILLAIDRTTILFNGKKGKDTDWMFVYYGISTLLFFACVHLVLAV